MSDDQQPTPAPAPSSGYGQPYGYGPQPYDYPQHYPTTPATQHPYPYGYAPPPAGPYGVPAASTGGHRNWLAISGCAAVVAAAVVALGFATNHTTTTAGTALDGSTATNPGITQPSTSPQPFGSGNGTGSGSGSAGSGSTGTTTASAQQQIGVVDIDTVIGYNSGEAAGTGLVLDSSGDILTNNHVIDGATSIKVTVVSTGKTYTATVVGTAPTQDVAVIKLVGASGLTRANFGSSTSIKVGDVVTGVGNAGGVGGTPSAAKGSITALNQTITASDESGTNSEQLTGIIATNAPIKAGDSGGPLFNSSDKVIGIDTAANSTQQQAAGFAIPINHALSVAAQIETGVETSSIHIGFPAALGIAIDPNAVSGSGVAIAQVYTGRAAAAAGLVPGDVVTALDGKTVGTETQLRSLIAGHDPGDKVSVTYTDLSGTSHSVTVTLGDGPAD